MSFEIPNMMVALPEMVILTTTCIALLAELFLSKNHPRLVYYMVCAGLVVAAVLNYSFIGDYKLVAYHGLFVSDDLANIMKVFIDISVLIAFIYSRYYVEERNIPQGEYYILGLLSTMGMMVLVSAHSLLTIYLGLELLSLPIYAMTAIRRTDAKSSEAAMKYFVMGAIASGMLLYGMSIIYGATGQLDISMIANKISTIWPKQSLMIGFALVFIVVGVGFKMAAVPFHMWAPDVYEGAPTSVTLFISSAPKIAAIGMTMRLLVFAMPDVISQWQQLLIVMALLSTALGNLLAIAQTNIKRMLAYSAISHIGYTLFGLIAGTAQGYSAALFYILIYSLMSVAAFGIVVLMSRASLEVENIDDFKGMNQRNPLLAFLMLIVMLSMAGVPPTVGFFTKLLVLKALVDVNLTNIAVFGLLFAVVGAFYYIRIIKIMYFDSPCDTSEIVLDKGLTFIFSLNALALLYLGLFPSGLIQACISAFS
jgi:NADH-quinone oxidoreductase subunit N